MTEQSPEIPADAETVTTGTSDPVAVHRSRRRTWFAVAAASVAGVAVVGGSAYAMGASNASGTALKPAFTLSNNSGASHNSAPTAMGGAASADMKLAPGYMPYWGGGHTTFTADAGLSNSTGTATAYAFDAASTNPEALANALAKSLGIAGAATFNGYSWVVGAQDGSAANVSVNVDGMVNVNYYDPSADPFTCAATNSVPPAPAPNASGGSTGSGSSPATPAPDACTPQNTAALGTEADAIGASKAVITSLGLDPANFNWTATTPKDAGQPVIYVSGELVVNGQLTGNIASFTFGGGNKLSNFSAFAAPVTSLGTYDVVSAQDAVARLMDPKFGPGLGGPIAYATAGGVAPMMKSAVASDAAVGTATSVTSSPAPQATLPPTPANGSKFTWPITNITIVKADLGLAQYTQANGSVVLIPTYQLTGSDKSTWTVIAVAGSALDNTPLPAN